MPFGLKIMIQAASCKANFNIKARLVYVIGAQGGLNFSRGILKTREQISTENDADTVNLLTCIGRPYVDKCVWIY